MKLKKILNEVWVDEESQETPIKLNLNDKKRIMAEIAKYSSYGKILYSEGDLEEVAKSINDIAKNAEAIVLSDNENNWFDKVTVERNFKQIKLLSEQFSKVASEAKTLQQRLIGLYEDLGLNLDRYFEIKTDNENKIK